MASYIVIIDPELCGENKLDISELPLGIKWVSLRSATEMVVYFNAEPTDEDYIASASTIKDISFQDRKCQDGAKVVIPYEDYAIVVFYGKRGDVINEYFYRTETRPIKKVVIIDQTTYFVLGKK